MNIRKANISDIPFITCAILEIEKSGISNTYSNLFSVDKETAKKYLETFFLDEENLGTELSLNTFFIAEVDGETAGCCSLIFTNHDYYLNKGEIYPIHLKPDHLNHFIENAKTLPDHKKASENKCFVEYIFVDEKFRRKGIAGKLIQYQIDTIQETDIYINVFDNNTNAYSTYKNLGFCEYQTVNIDTLQNKIYPSIKKIILTRKI